MKLLGLLLATQSKGKGKQFVRLNDKCEGQCVPCGMYSFHQNDSAFSWAPVLPRFVVALFMWMSSWWKRERWVQFTMLSIHKTGTVIKETTGLVPLKYSSVARKLMKLIQSVPRSMVNWKTNDRAASEYKPGTGGHAENRTANYNINGCCYWQWQSQWAQSE